MSGFAKPSSVYPYADHGAATSSFVDTDLPVSLAPTVITNGSLPGANGTPLGPAADP